MRKIMYLRQLLFISCIGFMLCVVSVKAETVSIQYNPQIGQQVFAAEALIQACLDCSVPLVSSQDATYKITLSLQEQVDLETQPNSVLGEEAFTIRRGSNRNQNCINIIGGGQAGVMYGGLELAEQITLYGIEGVRDVTQSPYMNMRGIKFNIPLDVRTPSYTDVCDAAQQNMGEMWSFAFWKDCIDNLARHRCNFISLWSLHPFPSMVRVPDYPDVALDDVHRSKVAWKEFYSGLGVGFDAPEIINNVEVIKKITMDEKMAFWRKVMAYGKERNVDFYVVTWNIFVNGTHGKYGITDRYDNLTTTDYFRKSVKQMFVTYPDLAGIGLTTGENMPKLSTAVKEKWAFDTFGQGMLDAAKLFPGRKMTLLHRQHQTGAQQIAEQFRPLVDHPDINFLFSFKYAKAHVHSCTTQPYHQEYVKDIAGMKTIWTLRNDDTFYFRWGSPDFVREFIQNIPLDVSEGWYFGSDQWIWGREFLSKDPKSPREIEISKHWYQWLLWGRLGYDPQISNARFQKILQVTYPEVDAAVLLQAWQEASMVYPKTTGFHWGMFDFQWYIEGCKGRPHYARTKTGFHDVNRFINLPPLKTTGYQSIPDYVEDQLKGEESELKTPLQVAGEIHAHADKAMYLLKYLTANGNDDLRRTLHDIHTVSVMGKYYAYKIEGATYLEMYRQGKDTSYQQKAIERLNRAAEQWRLYASLALSVYNNPLWTNRVGHVNWRDLMQDVLNDVKVAGGEPVLDNIPNIGGGDVLDPIHLDNTVKATFDVPKAGRYALDVVYIYTGESVAGEVLNRANSIPLVFWTTGGSNTEAWDRIYVDLKSGKNTIHIVIPEGADIKVNHLLVNTIQ